MMFYSPQDRTLNTRHPAALYIHHMQNDAIKRLLSTEFLLMKVNLENYWAQRSNFEPRTLYLVQLIRIINTKDFFEIMTHI